MIGRVMLLLLSLVCSGAAVTLAQEHRSVLRGVVIDAGGQGVPDVELRIVNEATGETRTFTSDRNGRFTILQLAPGTYRVVPARSSESPDILARLTIGLNESVDLTLPLRSTSISSSVDFRSFLVPVDRHSVATRTRLPGSFLADVPLDGRSFLNGVLFAPGIAAAPLGPAGSGGLGSTYLLNGFYVTEPILGVPAVIPDVEWMTDIEIAHAPYDASIGRTAGARVQIVLRSGTNALRGGVFGFAESAADRQQAGGFAGGPIARDRAFAFGSYQHTRLSDPLPFQEGAHHVAARFDQLLGSNARLTAGYALSEGSSFDRRGQHFGAGVAHLTSASTANDARFSVSRVSFAPIADIGGIAESQAFEVADTFTLTRGGHVVRTGGEWYAFSRGLHSGELAVQTWTGFVQDEWRASPALVLSGGVRVAHVAFADDDAPGRTDVGPVAGFAWTAGVDDAKAVVVRGNYGRSHQQDHAFTSTPALDHWTLGIERQWGRNRTIEAAYAGARGSDLLGASGRSRYHALLIELDQRSEVGLTGHVGYTLGRWTFAFEPGPLERTPIDARHKLTGAFTWWLPVGDERAVLSKGLVGDILKDLQVAGVLAVVAGHPDRSRAYQTLNLSIAKNWVWLGDRRLQVRFETFNVANRANRRSFFFIDPLASLFGPEERGRRYQLGARFLF